MHLQEEGAIRNLGVTNFDAKHLAGLLEQDAPIVSNQVSFSVLDTRPTRKMVPVCQQHGVQLLCYGALLGGFLSATWLGRREPSINSLTNISLRKYLPWIYDWGGWELFQELLTALQTVGNKHGVSLSAVALRWVLDQPTVAGVIVGARLGYTQHSADNQQVFTFSLDEDDFAMIESVQRRSTSLFGRFGDCGGEYRRRS